MKPVSDNRMLIERLEEKGKAVRIGENIDWNLEASALFRRTHEEKEKGPAILFENVKDYPNQRIAGGLLDTFEKVAIALGIDSDMEISEIIKIYKNRSEKKIPPKIVKNGPVKENIILSDDVNLFEIAAPMVHGGDGGRYVSTWQFQVSKDPDTDWTNWGTYRQMILDECTLSGMINEGSHQAIIFRKYEKSGEPMPIATVIGPDPVSSMLGPRSLPQGESEVDQAGGLRGEPVKLVEAETSDLLVPNNAEMIIEGEILPRVRVPEGPFGEYPGYRVEPAGYRLAIKVNAITYRDNPIITVSNMGYPNDDGDIVASITRSVSIKSDLQRHGIPVIEVYRPPEALYCCVIQVDPVYPNIASTIHNIVYGDPTLQAWLNQLIVVPPDINPFDLGEVFHALFHRCNPNTDFLLQSKSFTGGITTFLPNEKRKRREGPKITFDCTWPKHWSDKDLPIKSSWRNEIMYPPNVQNKVCELWEKHIASNITQSTKDNKNTKIREDQSISSDSFKARGEKIKWETIKNTYSSIDEDEKKQYLIRDTDKFKWRTVEGIISSSPNNLDNFKKILVYSPLGRPEKSPRYINIEEELGDALSASKNIEELGLSFAQQE
ncbi:hypothetical protein AKJ39_05150 [candidate division MSBL1 archaeon SCGC-AAA259J03]|uniref:3-octaprenyl-4-hydroxybenzoate carboxy-lyase n=1 Tax=candidate division MSBL1 archaeon SCGC-AAA259J03 TaxID=1698269 RepID=A0A656YUZ2_9EURY|nr:hypothetical protein AKJ39_05150 [candidate division MSBL1 archaeon SCGC-AAA259J03]